MKKLIVSVALASLLATGAVFAKEHGAHPKKKAKTTTTTTEAPAEGAAPAPTEEHPTH